MTRPAAEAGPILYFRGAEGARVTLAVLTIRHDDVMPGAVTTPLGTAEPTRICARAGAVAWRHDIVVPAGADAWYDFEGTRYPVHAVIEGDMRIAYASCNGQEEGDLERPEDERNAMWRRLGEDHAAAPFSLLLQGGDQVYADEVTKADPITEDWPDMTPRLLDAHRRQALRETLAEAFFRRYAQQFAQADIAHVSARIPSLAMWDDHDICDGWGSLPERLLDCDAGRTLFDAAREAFLVFQFACAADEVPPICPDATGRSLGWRVTLPGLTLIGPDLRSERRPDRVMGPAGWTMLTDALSEAREGRVMLMSSVPALGPRLSLIESLMLLTRRMEKYEDDLRDQWQSRAHRAEWQEFLRALLEVHGRAPVTVLSGEIHLATRATMDTDHGPLHQLVSSGVTHPAPPKAWALTLGALANLGEAPLAKHPIRIRSLPGWWAKYTAKRNYLTLTRSGGGWSAAWEVEGAGPTPALHL